MIQKHNINPSSILLTTFTHNASENMRNKVASLVGSAATPPLIGTFHSLARQIIQTAVATATTNIYHIDELPFQLYDFLYTNEGITWAQTIKYVFVDEYQDVNEIQYKIIKRLHEFGAYVTIVGDDAQNIYSWRGSSVDYILRFEECFAPIMDFQLSINYRSSQAIIDCANDVMRYIPTLSHKEAMLCGNNVSSGPKPILKHFSRFKGEKDWVCGQIGRLVVAGVEPSEIAILCKYNTLLYQIEEQLSRVGIQTRLLSGGQSEQSAVILSTYHAAKGLEWKYVILMGMNDDYFPQSKTAADILQERRLFYVGITRAQTYLYLTYSGEMRNLSRYVRDIQRHHIMHNQITTYVYSTLSSMPIKRTVSELVRTLGGEDYIRLRDATILPDLNFKRHDFFVGGEQFTYPDWAIKNDLIGVFSTFVEILVQRMIGELVASSGGLINRQAASAIYSIRVGKHDWEIYSRYKHVFDVLLAEGYAEEPDFDEVSGLLDELWPDTVDHITCVRIVEILFKVRGILSKMGGQRIEDFVFSQDTYCVPADMRLKLIAAEKKFTDGRLSWRAVLYETWLVACCKSVACGRNAIFYKDIRPDHIAECGSFYETLEAVVYNFVGLTRFKGSFLCNPIFRNEHMIGHTSIMAGLGTVLINIDCGLTNIKMDAIVEFMCNVHLAREMGHNIKTIVFFNPLRGQWYEMFVEDWITGWELGEFLLLQSSQG